MEDTSPSARHAAAIGPLPEVLYPNTSASAWSRECGSGNWVRLSRAHTIFQGVDPGAPANAFAKQMVLVTFARRGGSRVEHLVVRRSVVAVYVRKFRELAPTIQSTLDAVPSISHVVMLPP